MRKLFVIIFALLSVSVWSQTDGQIDGKKVNKKKPAIKSNKKAIDLGEIEGVELEAMKPALSSVIRRQETRKNAGKKLQINKKIKTINKMLY